MEIVFEKYPRQYKASNSQRARYYQQGKKSLPLSFCDKQLYDTQGIREPDNINYAWRQFPKIKQGKKILINMLVDLKTNERVSFNPNEIGKPKIKNINGQDIYSGNIARHERNNMIGEIKDYFRAILIEKKIPKIEKYPIYFEAELHDLEYDEVFSRGKPWDIRNRFFPYGKALEDVMVDLGILTDDNIYYLSKAIDPIFVPISESNYRKIVIRIVEDKRPIILNNEWYIRELKNKIHKI